MSVGRNGDFDEALRGPTTRDTCPNCGFVKRIYWTGRRWICRYCFEQESRES